MVPLIPLLSFVPCPHLVLLHVPLLFPLILFLLSCSSIPVILLSPFPVTLFLFSSSLSSASCSSSLSSHLVPLILFLTPSHLIVPRILLLCLFLSYFSSYSCSSSLSSHLDPLSLFLSPSRLIVPFFLLLCFFPCLLLVLHHVPIPLLLFLLSCSSLPVSSLFPLSCYSVSFLIFS